MNRKEINSIYGIYKVLGYNPVKYIIDLDNKNEIMFLSNGYISLKCLNMQSIKNKDCSRMTTDLLVDVCEKQKDLPKYAIKYIKDHKFDQALESIVACKVNNAINSNFTNKHIDLVFDNYLRKLGISVSNNNFSNFKQEQVEIICHTENTRYSSQRHSINQVSQNEFVENAKQSFYKFNRMADEKIVDRVVSFSKTYTAAHTKTAKTKVEKQIVDTQIEMVK